MRKTVVVVFAKGQAPRILTGVNPKDYLGRSDCLINPTFPKGVPPHCWTLSNGKIHAIPRASEKPLSSHPQVTLKQHLRIAEALAIALLFSLLTYLLKR
jgi:hypothetical protein